VSRKRKLRVVYQERLANRQAVERLRRAYVKLYTQGPSEMNYSITNPEKNLAVQEKQE
jgi:hypothetical protein